MRYIDEFDDKYRSQMNSMVNDKLNEFLEEGFDGKSVYEVYKRLSKIFNERLEKDLDLKLDLDFFTKLKEIIQKLVLVKPEDRMKLYEAKIALDELADFAKENSMKKFLTLNSFLRTYSDQDMIVEHQLSQNSYGQMSEIRLTRMFTNASVGDVELLTQRDTFLCVSFSAMRLLSHSLLDFLLKNGNLKRDGQTAKELAEKILENRFHFTKQLLDICCGVISPRSLNGLNHGFLDNEYQLQAQEQHICKFLIATIDFEILKSRVYFWASEIKDGVIGIS